MLEEEALNELAPLCFAPETFELIGKVAVTQKPAFALLWCNGRRLQGLVMDICTSSCYSGVCPLPPASRINSPASTCSGEHLTYAFGPRCLIYAVSRWLGPLRQTSIAKIRVGGLLKRFFKFCFANLLRVAVFLSCFHSICLSRGQREGLHAIGGC